MRSRRRTKAPGDGAPRSAEERSKKVRREVKQAPGSDAAPSRGRLDGAVWRAGNQAVMRALHDRGQPLDAATRSDMERAFGMDFSDVRVHHGVSASNATTSMTAEAFAHGEDIVLREPPGASNAPDTRHLLAHELAHVVQSRQAGEVQNELIGTPGGRFEQSAYHAASLAVGGQRAHLPMDGAPPAIQRQFKTPGASRAEVEEAVRDYLQRAVRAQGGRRLQITPTIRTTLERLANTDRPGTQGDPERATRLINLQLLLDSPMTPRDPAGLARAVARILPAPFERSALEALPGRRVLERAPSTMERVGELIERSAPGSPEAEEEREAGARARGEIEPTAPRTPRRPTLPEGAESAEQAAERRAQIGRAMRGEGEPTTIGPVPIDIPRVGRILRGLPEAIREPSVREPAPPARSFPAAERAIAQVPRDALIPPSALRRRTEAERALELAGPDEEPARRRELGEARSVIASYADAQEVARDLARRLDVAQQESRDTIELRLGANYERLRGAERQAMIRAVEDIVGRLRAAFPHATSSVRFVDVYFGRRLVTRNPLSSSP